jgi:hypothetical protein
MVVWRETEILIQNNALLSDLKIPLASNFGALMYTAHHVSSVHSVLQQHRYIPLKCKKKHPRAAHSICCKFLRNLVAICVTNLLGR